MAVLGRFFLLPYVQAWLRPARFACRGLRRRRRCHRSFGNSVVMKIVKTGHSCQGASDSVTDDGTTIVMAGADATAVDVMDVQHPAVTMNSFAFPLAPFPLCCWNFTRFVVLARVHFVSSICSSNCSTATFVTVSSSSALMTTKPKLPFVPLSQSVLLKSSRRCSRCWQ